MPKDCRFPFALRQMSRVFDQRIRQMEGYQKHTKKKGSTDTRRQGATAGPTHEKQRSSVVDSSHQAGYPIRSRIKERKVRA